MSYAANMVHDARSLSLQFSLQRCRLANSNAIRDRLRGPLCITQSTNISHMEESTKADPPNLTSITIIDLPE